MVRNTVTLYPIVPVDSQAFQNKVGDMTGDSPIKKHIK